LTLEQNKSLVRRMLNWWVSGDVSVIDETNAQDVVVHESGGREVRGRDANKERLSFFINSFSDRTITIDDVIAEGDRVAVRYSWSGLSSAKRQVNSKTIAIYRIADGKIAEEWEEHDTQGLSGQLGL
jgi:ketosteroid isomerase-like protein